jgi:hypothetical protein
MWTVSGFNKQSRLPFTDSLHHTQESAISRLDELAKLHGVEAGYRSMGTVLVDACEDETHVYAIWEAFSR